MNNDSENIRDQQNIEFLFEILLTQGTNGLMSWFGEQDTTRQSYVVELLQKMSQNMNDIYLTIQTAQKTNSDPFQHCSKSVH